MNERMKSAARIASRLAIVAMAAACATDRSLAPPEGPTAPDLQALSAMDLGTETGTWLVIPKSAGGVSTAGAAIAALGATVTRQIPGADILYVENLSDANAATLAANPGITVVKDRLMRWIPDISSFQPTFVTTTGGVSATGTDQSSAQFFNQYQWSLKVTRANQAWVPSGGGLGETACVLDTGVDPGHLDLAGTVDPARNLSVILTPRFPSDASSNDYNFHGTFVSAQIRSRGIGMASVAPNATLCSIKVLSEDGRGTFGDIIYGIYAATQLGADVINLSLGGYAQETNPGNAPLLAALQGVIDQARNAGTVVVAASGNDGFNMGDIREALGFIHIPSQMRGVVSVGATGPYRQKFFDKLTDYSNFGGMDALDLVAPGGNGGLPEGATEDFILSACSRYAFGGACAAGNRYLFGNGTSFSAPLVAGAAAVVESTIGTLSASKLESCLLSTTDFVGGTRAQYGRGRLNVLKASRCSSF